MYKDIYQIDHSLRDYQDKSKKEIFTSWDSCDSVLFQMPTGTGKTRLFSSIVSDISKYYSSSALGRILIIAHRQELIEQISSTLDSLGVGHSVFAGDNKKVFDNKVFVASIQTITHKSNHDRAIEIFPQFVIIDEAHHAIAKSYQKLWNLFPDAKFLGVTATPYRMGRGGFSKIFDKLITSEQTYKFIKDKWLSEYEYYCVIDNSLTYNTIKSIKEYGADGDYKVSVLKDKIDIEPIRSKLLDNYLKYAKGKKGIIYSICKDHSKHICKEYSAAGLRIVDIDSDTPKQERAEYIRKFKAGLLDIIVNVDIFSEGFDCPDIEFIQLARPTRSLSKYLQQVGRGLRKSDDRKCIILDNVGILYTWGLPDKIRNWEAYFEDDREKIKKKEVSGWKPVASTSNKETSWKEGDEPMVQVYNATEEQLKELEFQKKREKSSLFAIFRNKWDSMKHEFPSEAREYLRKHKYIDCVISGDDVTNDPNNYVIHTNCLNKDYQWIYSQRTSFMGNQGNEYQFTNHRRKKFQARILKVKSYQDYIIDYWGEKTQDLNNFGVEYTLQIFVM